MPPRPLDYDYYYYQDEEGNWWNEYDDMGYEFDPDRYEGDEECPAVEQVPPTNAAETSALVETAQSNKSASEKNKSVKSDDDPLIAELKASVAKIILNNY